MRDATWQDILDLAKQQGIVTPADVRSLDLAPENLNRLALRGLLVRSGRGIYEHPDFEVTEQHSYVEVAKAIPKGVFCLLTALRIHDVGTQNPHQVWIAIPRVNRIPRTRTAELRVVRMSPLQYETEIVTRQVEGASIRVYSLEKTIVDCFRLRHLVGHEAGIEGLKEALKLKRASPSKIMTIARELRAARLVGPYIEALLQ